MLLLYMYAYVYAQTGARITAPDRKRILAMNILVFSDSHGNVEDMIRWTHLLQPDGVFHLGDLQRDARALEREFPRLPVMSVPGNCDGWTDEADIRNLRVEGCRVLASHGHRWQVKSGYGAAIAAARRAGASVLLFGHTHEAYCELVDGLWVMNPGSIGAQGRGSCGLLTIQGGRAACRLLEPRRLWPAIMQKGDADDAQS